MNYKEKSRFELRHSEGRLLPDGRREYEEDFYLNRQRSPVLSNSLLHCFAYGESIWHGGYQTPYRTISGWWSFEYIVEGNIDFISDGIRYKGNPGDIVILRPKKTVSLRTGTCGFVRKKCLLILDSPLLDYLFCSGSLTGTDVIRVGNSSEVNEIFLRIRKGIAENAETSQRDIGILLYTLLIEFEQLAMPQQYPEPLRRALDIINSFPERNYSLDALSRECKVGPRTLSRLFQLHLKISPINYIIRHRLELAKLLLNMNNMPLKEIADKCGYKSESFFSRSFKRQYGLSPDKFRRNTT